MRVEGIFFINILLNEEKIPHREEAREKWIGHNIPRYEQYVVVYVQKEYKEKVESYLKEYYNPNNIVYEDAEELRYVSNDEEEEIREYKKRNMAKKILAIIPFAMILIIIICGIIFGL